MRRRERVNQVILETYALYYETMIYVIASANDVVLDSTEATPNTIWARQVLNQTGGCKFKPNRYYRGDTNISNDNIKHQFPMLIPIHESYTNARTMRELTNKQHIEHSPFIAKHSGTPCRRPYQ